MSDRDLCARCGEKFKPGQICDDCASVLAKLFYGPLQQLARQFARTLHEWEKRLSEFP